MKTYKRVYSESIENPESFWRKQAEYIKWFQIPDKVLSKNQDESYRWFKAGKLNTSYLAIDKHIEEGRGDQLALIYDSPVTSTKEKYTYADLLNEVELVAGMLKKLGVVKGDRVIIYMPMVPQTVFAMLACARIGAIHSVVFGGFAPHELAIRIDDAEPKVILTASCGIEVKKIIPYKPLVDAALEEAVHKVDGVVVLQRPQANAELSNACDYDWDELRARSVPASYIEVDANDLLYIIYTSGTTGKPKGVMRDNGGHAVAMDFSMRSIYGIKPGEVFWAASDVGWVVGHSYIVYAPLIHGCTTVLYEGKPVKTPDAGSFWRVIEEYGVNVFFTAPTAFRAIVKEDPGGLLKQKYDVSSLRFLFLAGERCDTGTLSWLEDLLHIPVIDHWWQTESGWPMVANMPGIELLPVKPGSAGMAVPGYDMIVLDPQGKAREVGREGSLAIRRPLPPGMLTGLWRNPGRFQSSYFDKFSGYYNSEDSAYADDEGYIYITGRMDDIINVAGHRLSTATMEEVISSNENVAECAVVGVEDDMKGQVPVGFVVLKDGADVEEADLVDALMQSVRDKVGPVASFKKCYVVNRLPKTRSGKILRKTIRSIADRKEYVIPSTIEDPIVLYEIDEVINYEAKQKELLA